MLFLHHSHETWAEMTQLQAHRQMEVKEKWAGWCKSGVENNKIQKTQQNLAKEGGNKAGQ